MRRRPLWAAGPEVSVLGLGGAGILMDQKFPATEGDIESLFTRAQELGINYVDTSPAYGSGLSEQRIGRYLQDSDFFISTKTGLIDRDGEHSRDYSRSATLRSIERSLDALGRPLLDLVQIHEVDQGSVADALAGALPTLLELRNQGVVGHVGVTGSDPLAVAQVLDHGGIEAVMLWRCWNLLDQSGGPLIERCATEGIGVIIGAPFASGILATGAVSGASLHYSTATAEELKYVRKLEESDNSSPLIQRALQFCLRDDVTSVVTAVDTIEQLEQNARMLG